MSAIRRCCLAVTSRRSRATRRVSQMAGGMTRRERRLSRQLRATMAIAVPTAVVTLDAMDVAVEVTTDCIPATSLVRRDWTSPPRVRVKKESDWRWRWLNTSVRNRCMTSWPTRVEMRVWPRPSTAVATVTASMPPTARRSSRTSCWGRASSMTSRRRNGEARETSEDETMRAITTVIRARKGANSDPTRRQLTGDSASWARSAGSTRRGPRPPPPGPPPRPSGIPMREGEDSGVRAMRTTPFTEGTIL